MLPTNLPGPEREDDRRIGLVTSLNRPGGNATGINLVVEELDAKRLGLLRDLVPPGTLIAILLNPTNPTFATRSTFLEWAARAIGLQIQILSASSEQDVDRAFETIANIRASALMVGSDPSFTSWRKTLLKLAAQQSLPVAYS